MTLKESPGFTVLGLLMTSLLLCLHAGCTTPPPTASALHRLQGTWEGAELSSKTPGGPRSPEKITLTITGHSLHFHRDSNFWFKTTFTLPASTGPQQLLATIKDCNDCAQSTNTIGQVVPAIFKIEDGTMSLVAFQDNSAGAPKGFQDKDSMHYAFQKVQPQRTNGELPKSK